MQEKLGSVSKRESVRNSRQRRLLSGSSGVGFAGRFLVPLDGVVDFAPMYWNFLGGFYAQADLIAPNLNDHDRNVIVDDNTFVLFPRQD
jgi:hypothetical protein